MQARPIGLPQPVVSDLQGALRSAGDKDARSHAAAADACITDGDRRSGRGAGGAAGGGRRHRAGALFLLRVSDPWLWRRAADADVPGDLAGDDHRHLDAFGAQPQPQGRGRMGYPARLGAGDRAGGGDRRAGGGIAALDHAAGIVRRAGHPDRRLSGVGPVALAAGRCDAARSDPGAAVTGGWGSCRCLWELAAAVSGCR